MVVAGRCIMLYSFRSYSSLYVNAIKYLWHSHCWETLLSEYEAASYRFHLQLYMCIFVLWLYIVSFWKNGTTPLVLSDYISVISWWRHGCSVRKRFGFQDLMHPLGFKSGAPRCLQSLTWIGWLRNCWQNWRVMGVADLGAQRSPISPMFNMLSSWKIGVLRFSWGFPKQSENNHSQPHCGVPLHISHETFVFDMFGGNNTLFVVVFVPNLLELTSLSCLVSKPTNLLCSTSSR